MKRTNKKNLLSFFSRLKRKKLFSFLALIFLVVTVPVTVIVFLNKTQSQNFAAGNIQTLIVDVKTLYPGERVGVASGCAYVSGIGYECKFLLSETANSQGKLTWVATDSFGIYKLTRVDFNKGYNSTSCAFSNTCSLSPGQSDYLSIYGLPCNNGTITIKGSQNSVILPWTCSAASNTVYYSGCAGFDWSHSHCVYSPSGQNCSQATNGQFPKQQYTAQAHIGTSACAAAPASSNLKQGTPVMCCSIANATPPPQPSSSPTGSSHPPTTNPTQGSGNPGTGSAICSSTSNPQCSFNDNCSQSGAICQCADNGWAGHDKKYQCLSGKWSYQGETTNFACTSSCR